MNQNTKVVSIDCKGLLVFSLVISFFGNRANKSARAEAKKREAELQQMREEREAAADAAFKAMSTEGHLTEGKRLVEAADLGQAL